MAVLSGASFSVEKWRKVAASRATIVRFVSLGVEQFASFNEDKIPKVSSLGILKNTSRVVNRSDQIKNL